MSNNLIDGIGVLNPSLLMNRTYLHGSKRIDYILLSPVLSELEVMAGHHQFDQYLTSDHKGSFVHFLVGELFDGQETDKSHEY